MLFFQARVLKEKREVIEKQKKKEKKKQKSMWLLNICGIVYCSWMIEMCIIKENNYVWFNVCASLLSN